MISVVMPAHNEEHFLETAVLEVASALRDRGHTFEIVVVENGSTDETRAIARRLAETTPEVRAVTLPEADYGGALRRGFDEADGELIALFDVDYYDFGFFDKAVAVMDGLDGPDIVVGSKRGAGAVDTRSWLRRAVTTIFATTLRVGFGLGVSDTHGIKVVRRAPLKDLAAGCRYGTDLFDTELILRAQRAGLRATEIPVVVEERRPSRSSIAKRIPRTLMGLARLRLALWREKI